MNKPTREQCLIEAADILLDAAERILREEAVESARAA